MGLFSKTKDNEQHSRGKADTSSEIAVEKNVFYLDESKKWSISLRSVEPYGKYQPKHIYVTAIFHKKLDKALKMAWREFDRSKAYQDNHDKFCDSKQTEIVRVAV